MKTTLTMGAIKPNDYTEQDIQLSLTARAMAHPARVRMIKLLREHNGYRNIDFTQKLNLSKQSVADHVGKLKEAGLVGVEYFPHHYLISLETRNLKSLLGFLSE
jgi:ArsR family transcriptional regulator